MTITQRTALGRLAVLLVSRRRNTAERNFLGFTAAFLLVTLFAWPQKYARDGPPITLGIAIKLPAEGAWPVAVGADHAIFYVPVVGNGEMLGVLEVHKGHFLGIRIIPSMRGDSVEIAVAAMRKDQKKLSEATCEDIRSWPSVDAGSYEGSKGASFPLSGLSKLGLPVFEVDIVLTTGPPPGGFHHPYANFMAYCSCESTRDELNPFIGTLAYPDAGKCVEIGKCARCCRIITSLRHPSSKTALDPSASWHSP